MRNILYYLQVLILLKFCSGSWVQLSPDSSSLGPSPRFGSIALLISAQTKTIAISGGCSSSCCYAPLGDLWAFQNGGWINLTQIGSEIPSNRLFHSSSPSVQHTNVDPTYYVFGGTDIVNGELNDLYLLTVMQSNGSGSWKRLSVQGSLPEARSGQSQNSLTNQADPGSFIIFGGESSTEILSDAWIFSPLSNAWNKVAFTAGSGPHERTQHASVSLTLPSSNGLINGLVISGGSDSNGDDASDIWLLTIGQQSMWILLGQGTGTGSSPSVRHGHSLWLSSQTQKSGQETGESIIDLEFFFFGGQNCSVPDPVNFLSDTWLFSVSLVVSLNGQVSLANGQAGTFSLVDAGGSTGPSARALGGLEAFAPGNSSEAIYATGFSGYEGGNDDRLHNDVWMWNNV
jgi:hypothetical protein